MPLMRLGDDQFFHLTYCTNIHPSNGWDAVFESLRRYAPALKSRLAPDRPFGIGLRLSGTESRELLEESGGLLEFQRFLDENGLYVFTVNGFPHGPFHHQPVKAKVHAPDWREEERVAYTERLTRILAALLPEGMDGGISTSPLSYREWIDPSDTASWELMTKNVVRAAAAMARVRDEQAKTIHLDIEPEPDGLLGTSADLIDFFDRWLLPAGGPMLADELGISDDEARSRLCDHVRVCFDTCHLAVNYESPGDVLDHFAERGIRVGKVQVSSALKLRLPSTGERGDKRERMARALTRFVESTYLHQVVQRNEDGTYRSYPDLPQALPFIHDRPAREWRVHFHVPIFLERYGEFDSTQEEILATFALLRERRFTPHLEIETYTWDVLPPDLKTDLLESIHREYRWAIDAF